MIKDNLIFWYDLETTGLNTLCGIHQIGLIIEKNGKVLEKANIKMNVLKGKVINDDALKVGNITRDTLKSYQSARDGFIELVNILRKYKGEKLILAGFNNISFDNKHFKQLFIDHGRLDIFDTMFNEKIEFDVVVEYKKFLSKFTPISEYNKPKDPSKIPTEYRTENIKLGTLANHFNIEIQAHDGMSDIEATRKLYYKVFLPDEEMHDIEVCDKEQKVYTKEQIEELNETLSFLQSIAIKNPEILLNIIDFVNDKNPEILPNIINFVNRQKGEVDDR